MEYYFKIANVTIKISTPFEIKWSSYMKEFQCSPTLEIDEYFECRITDEFYPKGNLIYKDAHHFIYMNNQFESRLHFFVGQKQPCMYYEETENKKIIWLNRLFLDCFKRDDNYHILNALAIEKLFIQKCSLVLHCSYIVYQGKAILFSAPSGTGKSTQAALWEKYQNATVINGDRAILVKNNNQYLAMGMPICGSSNICLNQSTPIQAIVYLHQDKHNHIEILNQKEAIHHILSETTINYFNAEFVHQAIEVIEQLSSEIPVLDFWCTKDETAVQYLKNILEELV